MIRPAVAILLGPPRSGTSALAAIFESLGYSFHPDIPGIHERLQAGLGYSWHDPRPLPEGWRSLPAALQAREEIGRIVDRDFVRSGDWGVADSRLCRLLPLWTDVLDERAVHASFVVCHDRPDKAAASLHSREGLPVARALALWLAHSVLAEKLTRDRCRTFVSCDMLRADWQLAMTKVASRLDLTWPKTFAEAAPRVEAAIEDAASRDQPPPVEPHDLPPWIGAWHRLLDTLAARPDVGAERRAAELAEQVEAALRLVDPWLACGPDDVGPDDDDRHEHARALEAEIDHLNRQLAHIKATRWWTVGARLQRTRMALAPPSTRRGAAVRRLVGIAGAWGAEGNAGLTRRLRARLRGLLASGTGSANAAAQRPGAAASLPHGVTRADDDLDATSSAVTDRRGEIAPVKLIEFEGRSRSAFVDDLTFPKCDHPMASVVVPVLNNVDYTLCCLASMLRRHQVTPYEVIVVDDGSSDATAELVPRVPNLRYVRNPANLGFVLSANRGASLARGEYILFLNNDTQVQERWLDALVEAFVRDPRVGIAGSKLVYPSGHLQEAGAVVRCDGTVELVGLNDDPRKPEYNRARPVDHCSGASLMVRRDVFTEVGGFDEIYVPAYFEDCDLSLKVRQAGRKVVYVPGSVVVHHLSVTTNDGDQGFKQRQIEKNRIVFLERWRPQLEKAERVRAIAFYLPQFHPIPENDAWWGRGFTEWAYVARSRPVFRGHVQPRLPSDLGFYDLRLPEVRQAQADLAASHGIHGFCYYYYWFNGRRLLDRPLAEVLASGRPDFPFCVCWANENWTRRWDGHEDEVLIGQHYTSKDDRLFMEALIPHLADRRYIRMDGRPLLLVYRAELMPSARRTLALWREVYRAAVGGELYLCSVQSFEGHRLGDPRRVGFDGAVEFPPHGLAVASPVPAEIIVERFEGRFFDYARTAANFQRRPLPRYPLFRTVMPSWDNTPRRPSSGDIFAGASPALYERWLRFVTDQTRQLRFGDERTVFINAWNEWGEGNHIEPDQHYGHAYLEATRRALGVVEEPRRRSATASAADGTG